MIRFGHLLPTERLGICETALAHFVYCARCASFQAVGQLEKAIAQMDTESSVRAFPSSTFAASRCCIHGEDSGPGSRSCDWLNAHQHGVVLLLRQDS